MSAFPKLPDVVKMPHDTNVTNRDLLHSLVLGVGGTVTKMPHDPNVEDRDLLYSILRGIVDGGGGGSFLPLAGGVMDSGATIGFANGTLLRANPDGAGIDRVCSMEYVERFKLGNYQVLQTDGVTIIHEHRYVGDAPWSPDDSTLGYIVGSVVVLMATGERFVCTDASAENAVWIGAGVGIDLGDIAFVSVAGNNATAEVGNPSKPFSTATAAASESSNVWILDGDHTLDGSDGGRLVFFGLGSIAFTGTLGDAVLDICNRGDVLLKGLPDGNGVEGNPTIIVRGFRLWSDPTGDFTDISVINRSLVPDCQPIVTFYDCSIRGTNLVCSGAAGASAEVGQFLLDFTGWGSSHFTITDPASSEVLSITDEMADVDIDSAVAAFVAAMGWTLDAGSYPTYSATAPSGVTPLLEPDGDFDGSGAVLDQIAGTEIDGQDGSDGCEVVFFWCEKMSSCVIAADGGAGGEPVSSGSPGANGAAGSIVYNFCEE